MKKIFSLLVILSLSLAVFAQTTTKNFAVSNFTGISAGSVFNIDLTKSSVESLKIEADSDVMPFIEAKVTGGILYLKLVNLPSKLSRNMDYINVKITIKELENLFLSGASKLKANGNFSPLVFKAEISGASIVDGLNITTDISNISVSGASKLDLKGSSGNAKYEFSGATVINISQDIKDLNVGGSGAVKLDYTGKTNKTEISISGATMAKFTGSSATATIEVSGASQLDASAFTVNDMNLEVSGVSMVKVNVKNSISAEVSGGSSVRYLGTPVIKDIETNSSSSFKKMD
ncbi:MAG: hypothetical protein ACD_77C00267G0005 [uncultured bacterium]|nr:MAG: hypothetical protein ACD_77C00267G0005 [uncultured bacterium]